MSPAAMLDLSELDLARFKWIGSGNYVGLKQNRSDGHVARPYLLEFGRVTSKFLDFDRVV